jgi:cytochrome c-type biogenesis protein CcmH
MTPEIRSKSANACAKVNASYQGTTSVVPYSIDSARVLTPETHDGSAMNLFRTLRRLNTRAAIVYCAIFLLACASVWAPIARAQQTDHAKKLGMNLMCMCGCAQVLVQCNHLNCPSSAPMLKELDERIATGESDETVIQDFIKGYGVAVLSSPPNTGFNRVAWLLPSVAFALGLGVIALVINHWRKRPVLATAAPQTSQVGISSDALARAREKVDRETEE